MNIQTDFKFPDRTVAAMVWYRTIYVAKCIPGYLLLVSYDIPGAYQ